MGVNILIIGSGGREHALGWKLAQDPSIHNIFYVPGNGGTRVELKGVNIAIDCAKKENFDTLWNFISINDVALTVVGPEAPLDAGLVDYLHDRGYTRVFGPMHAGARLESDKFLSYDLMKEFHIPQAVSRKCHTIDDAKSAIKDMATLDGIVIKARGLTAGKGVTVCDSKEQALATIEKHAAVYGSEVLIAERLHGEEFSLFGIADGNTVLPLAVAVQDHKRLLDNDQGPNTGGMGAYGPVPGFETDFVNSLTERVMTPVVRKLREQGIEYKGFLYAGMIMTATGPKVLEYNVRFGDPECQPAMMLLQDSLYKPLSLALEGRLHEAQLPIKPGASCCVVLASPGYPGEYRKELLIEGINEAERVENVKVFHAGTQARRNGEKSIVFTNGGRVLGVTAYSSTSITEATLAAYEAVSRIRVEGNFHYRTDIARKALEANL